MRLERKGERDAKYKDFFKSGMKNESKERMKWDDFIAGEGVVEKIIFFAFFVKLFCFTYFYFARSFLRNLQL
jgi:hypothetical protein